jgi:hypothetical protein
MPLIRFTKEDLEWPPGEIKGPLPMTTFSHQSSLDRKPRHFYKASDAAAYAQACDGWEEELLLLIEEAKWQEEY